MESALDLWSRRRDEPWIHGFPPGELRAQVEALHAQWATRAAPVVIAITSTTPSRFTVEFLAAVTFPTPIQLFLGPAPSPAVSAATTETRIMVATGGTTGTPRYAMHTWETLVAAVRSVQAALGGGPIHSHCFLPLHHVSGLMQLVRSFVSGGQLTLAGAPGSGPDGFSPVADTSVTSLVPTQLVRLLDVPGATDWLRGFRAVFLGGAAAWPELLERARRERLPLAPCYGMTETAAQITTMAPGEFFAGNAGVGRALPHARVEIVDDAGHVLPAGRAGRIRVWSTSLFRGYHPDARADEPFVTGDRGVMNGAGELTVLGRADAVINSGGEKIEPAEVEAAIRGTGLVADVAVVGLPDAEWGEIVVAVIAGAAAGSESEIAARVRGVLAAPKRPKRWVRVAALPRDAAGKMDRRQLRALAEN